IGAKNQEIRTGLLELEGFVGQTISRFDPAGTMLKLFDFVKIDTAQNDLCGMKASKVFCNCSVDDLIVGNCRFPAHATEQPNRFHSNGSFDPQTPNRSR